MQCRFFFHEHATVVKDSLFDHKNFLSENSILYKKFTHFTEAYMAHLP